MDMNSSCYLTKWKQQLSTRYLNRTKTTCKKCLNLLKESVYGFTRTAQNFLKTDQTHPPTSKASTVVSRRTQLPHSATDHEKIRKASYILCVDFHTFFLHEVKRHKNRDAAHSAFWLHLIWGMTLIRLWCQTCSQEARVPWCQGHHYLETKGIAPFTSAKPGREHSELNRPASGTTPCPITTTQRATNHIPSAQK